MKKREKVGKETKKEINKKTSSIDKLYYMCYN